MRVEMNNQSAPTEPAAQHTGFDDLGQDAFMKLLVAQIQNQDPMDPMDDRDFIAQMAQFSNLNQTQSLLRNQMTLLGAKLLGNTYEMVTSAGESTVGTIASAKWKDDDIHLKTTDGEQLTLKSIESLRIAEES